ncbi:MULTISPECIES: helix-turn-helix domain-containing protein [Nostocales]|uniref:helix-turn-helix domain-containing protein n=1 Tax=Nostocales TaxID=1161 RepID=UPI00059B93B1|nr:MULTISPECIES: helix-turn-helix transcriptional regulator [Nostocales]MBO1050716.1 helix-turn-helix transcriptional regulator [Dolichospermum sp. DET73]MTJ18523.1 helix-turn-helix transcriptional regulator [Dolichospermum sp. UHCC 0299]MTJ39192.1 helix-turn-helix transcriptional regulator [Dolichospermum sp. UHCC 0406]
MSTKTLGQRLHLIRKEQNLSMRSVARMAEISVAYLSKIEHDEANPTVDVLERLAKVLGLSLEELTVDVGRESSPKQDQPESLQNFINEYKDKYTELNQQDWQKMLCNIRLRGQYPENTEDWLMIFLDIRRALY